jgi:hypothetical protein
VKINSGMDAQRKVETTPVDLDPLDRLWLKERLEEYRELLDYLRDH